MKLVPKYDINKVIYCICLIMIFCFFQFSYKSFLCLVNFLFLFSQKLYNIKKMVVGTGSNKIVYEKQSNVDMKESTGFSADTKVKLLSVQMI